MKTGSETPVRAAAARFSKVRAATERIAASLSPEDCSAQSMPLASPIRWHLAHTSWFFETFVVSRAVPGHRPFDPRFAYLFNSYYNAIGERVPQPERGRITRPGLEEVLAYRRHVDARVAELLERASAAALAGIEPVLEIGLNHEQQHQELMLADLKHLLSLSPLRPAYRESLPLAAPAPEPGPAPFLAYEGGLHEIGHDGRGFAFDNEGPRHRVFTQSFELASRPVTNGEFLEFVEAGGYGDPSVWLSDGWDWVVAERVRAPLYWSREERGWRIFTLAGERELDRAEPVAHVSFYEADAYARWRGARLPREDEWELAALPQAVEGNFVESGALHPRPSPAASSVAPVAMFGDVWEWTQSPYVAYPGFRPAAGALGEYNGKFMCNRMVLRGGSCASPRSHLRASYRNFFLPTARWQFSGIRLARDV
jgi:ergothioneine biosynthesis protein EgtB